MKKIAMIALLALVSGMLFASGGQEGQPAVTGPFGEKVSLAGTFKLNQGFPELVSGGKTYSLMAPGARRPGYYSTLVKDGTMISVEGYRANPGPRAGRTNQPNQEVIFVQKARVDGKEYEVMHARGANGPRRMGGGQGGRGGRGGMMRGSDKGPGQGGPGYGPGPGNQGGPGYGPGPGGPGPQGRGRW